MRKKAKIPGLGAYDAGQPWGEVIAALDEVGVLTGEIDLGKLEQVRRQIPSLKNVREDVYRLESRRMKVYPEVM